MLEQDYLIRMLVQFAEAIRRSMQRAQGDQKPEAAAEMLEVAIGQATDFDGETLLSLAPESIVSVLQVSGIDPRVVEYLSRSLLLESEYLKEAGLAQKAAVREAQAQALAKGFDISLPEKSFTLEELEKFIEESEQISPES